MDIYSIGFTHTTAADFFGRLQRHGIGRLLDVRLSNTSQLAGFAKRDDLAYFLRELCQADYEHAPLLAPTQELFEDFKRHHTVAWSAFERRFLELMKARRIERELDRASFETPTVLLCSEETPDECHRRLVIEYLQRHWKDVQAVHL
jgi:uncharacterized protein (DUF488 family)